MRNIIIVDIDGTLSDPSHRLHHLDNGDWDSFYEDCEKDTPIEPIITLVRILHQHYNIIFCTGRRESVRKKTKNWLSQHVGYFTRSLPLIMRKDGDKRHDIIVKPEGLAAAGIALRNIEMVIEDRDSMVKKWREMGLTCIQTANGDF